MTGVFSGNQWTTPSGSSWNIIIEPDLVNQVSKGPSLLSPVAGKFGLREIRPGQDSS